MEPVPETERMEKFQRLPVPSVRVQQSASDSMATSGADAQAGATYAGKPPNKRRSTEPLSLSSPSWASASTPSMPYRPRTASPLAGAHGRSKSAASLPPLVMSRTRSTPGVDVGGRALPSPLLRPDSPSGSPSRVKVTRRPVKPVDEVFPATSPIRSSIFDGENMGSGPQRRTSSPFRPIPTLTVSSSVSSVSSPSSVATSPSYRFDASSNSYSFPSYYHSSSVPSTPTSFRSRSPSISSLETIPDSPDAEEEAALEDERNAKMDNEEAVGEGKGKASLDPSSRVRAQGLGLAIRDKRKRWSVCGAERRGDLDLETIWED